MVLPERRLRKVEEFFEMFPEAREVFVDGAERPVQRPKDSKQQKEKYSGKKKRHTVKNIIIADKHKRIGFLSKTSGRRRDFEMLKEHAPPEYTPTAIKQHIDLGFKGYHAEMVAKLFRSEILDFRARRGRRAKCFEAVAQLRRKAFCEV